MDLKFNHCTGWDESKQCLVFSQGANIVNGIYFPNITGCDMAHDCFYHAPCLLKEPGHMFSTFFWDFGIKWKKKVKLSKSKVLPGLYDTGGEVLHAFRLTSGEENFVILWNWKNKSFIFIIHSTPLWSKGQGAIVKSIRSI